MTDRQSHSSRILSGTFVLTLAQFISKAFFLVVVLGAAQYLGKTEYGAFENILAVTMMFYFLVADLGTDDYTVRELARRRDQSAGWLPPMISLRVVLGLCGAVGLLVWLLCVEQIDNVWLIVLPMMYLLLASAQAYLKSVARAWERLSIEGAMMIVEKMLMVLVGGVVLWWNLELPGVWAVFVVATIGAVVFGYWRLKTMVSGIYPGGCVAWQAIPHAVPFWMGTACVILLYNMDKIMLTRLVDESATGVYSVAHRLLIGLFVVPQMLSVALYPAVSVMHTSGESYRKMVSECFRILIALALPMMVGAILIAPALFGLFDHNEYQDSILVFQILMISLPFVFGNYVVGPLLKATNRQWENTMSSAIALGINFVLNIVLIVYWQANGAALATTLTQIIYFATMSWFAHRYLGALGWQPHALKSVFAVTVMGLVVLPLRHQFFLAIAVGAGVYFVVALSISLLTWSDLQRLRTLFRKTPSI